MDFAQNINRICREKGTTLTSVCKDLGLSTSKVNLWNNGSLPKQEMLVTLAQHLDCSVMDFFADDNDILPPRRATPRDEDERDILRIYRSLDRRSKHEFMMDVYAFEARLDSEDEVG